MDREKEQRYRHQRHNPALEREMLNEDGDADSSPWPSVAFSDATHLAAVWVGDLDVFNNVYASISDDGGVTWDNQYRLTDLAADTRQRAPALAIARDGSGAMWPGGG